METTVARYLPFTTATEPTLTHENVLKVLQSVQAEKWDDLAFAL